MNGFQRLAAGHRRRGTSSFATLIVVVAVLAGGAIAVVVAVHAAGPGGDKSTAATAGASKSEGNPLRSGSTETQPTANSGANASENSLPASVVAPAKPQASDGAAGNETPATLSATAAVLAPSAGKHPLDDAIAMAEKVLDNLRKHVKDYTRIIVKQERLDGKLGDPEFMAAKIRQQPASVYLNFLKPDDLRGREVIYAAGANDGKMLVRDASGITRALGMLQLPPSGPIAMHGNRYPITNIGLTHLTERLIEIAKQDRRYGEIEVHFFKDAKVNGRVCTMIEVKHPVERRVFLFYKAEIFIDDQLNLPIRYVAYMWPKKPNEPPPVDESYTYLNLKLNVGLTDSDFDPHNASYHFFDK